MSAELEKTLFILDNIREELIIVGLNDDVI